MRARLLAQTEPSAAPRKTRREVIVGSSCSRTPLCPFDATSKSSAFSLPQTKTSEPICTTELPGIHRASETAWVKSHQAAPRQPSYSACVLRSTRSTSKAPTLQDMAPKMGTGRGLALRNDEYFGHHASDCSLAKPNRNPSIQPEILRRRSLEQHACPKVILGRSHRLSPHDPSAMLRCHVQNACATQINERPVHQSGAACGCPDRQLRPVAQVPNRRLPGH